MVHNKNKYKQDQNSISSISCNNIFLQEVYCTSEQSSRGSNKNWTLKPNLPYKPTFKNISHHVKSDFSIIQLTYVLFIPYFCLLVFGILVTLV